MSRAKAKGTSWETATVNYLISRGAVHAERRALNGVNDKGDVSGIPGVVIEAKSCKEARLAEWMNEAIVERDNAGAALGVVWAKRRGHTSPARGYVIMDGEQFVDLLIGSGYFAPSGGGGGESWS